MPLIRDRSASAGRALGGDRRERGVGHDGVGRLARGEVLAGGAQLLEQRSVGACNDSPGRAAASGGTSLSAGRSVRTSAVVPGSAVSSAMNGDGRSPATIVAAADGAGDRDVEHAPLLLDVVGEAVRELVGVGVVDDDVAATPGP